MYMYIQRLQYLGGFLPTAEDGYWLGGPQEEPPQLNGHLDTWACFSHFSWWHDLHGGGLWYASCIICTAAHVGE